jgi:hypothetical protein
VDRKKIPERGEKVRFVSRMQYTMLCPDVHRASQGYYTIVDSASALFFSAASAALGWLLLSVTLHAASAALCRATASHHAGAREETGDANSCQELFEFLCFHETPPFLIALCAR